MSKAIDDEPVNVNAFVRSVRANWLIVAAAAAALYGYINLQRTVAENTAAIVSIRQEKGDRQAVLDCVRTLEKVSTAIQLDHDTLTRLVVLAEQQSKQR